MGTNLNYNTVTLFQCKTQTFSQENNYDESGTDVVQQKVLIHVRGCCHGVLVPNTVGTSPALATAVDTWVSIRQLLMEPRKALTFTVDGVSVMTIQPFVGDIGAGTDVNSGPKPIRCEVSEMTSGLFKVDYTIEGYIIDCATLANTQGILSNRWHYEDDWDETQFISRTLKGTLRVASININPQALRGLCMPPLLDGFARKSIRCATSDDGLTLTYIVHDKQVKAAPPYPARRWEGTHTLGTADGINTNAQISIMLEGDPGTDKRDLIATAAAVTLAKLEIAGVQNGVGYLLEACQITDHMNSCIIEMRTSVKRTFNNIINNLSALVDGLGKTLDQLKTPLAGYNPLKNPVTKAYPNDSLVGLFVCYLQSPCNDNHGIPQATDNGNANAPPATKSTTQVTTYQGTLNTNPAPGSNLSNATQQNIYTFAQIDSRTVTDQNKVQLPSGNPLNDPSADTCKIVQLFRPTGKMVVKIAVERVGAWPALPTLDDIVDGGIRYTLLHSEVEPKAPGKAADGVTKLYSVDAIYVYAMNRPPMNGEGFRAGALPWTTDQAGANNYPYASLTTGMI